MPGGRVHNRNYFPDPEELELKVPSATSRGDVLIVDFANASADGSLLPTKMKVSGAVVGSDVVGVCLEGKTTEDEFTSFLFEGVVDALVEDGTGRGDKLQLGASRTLVAAATPGALVVAIALAGNSSGADQVTKCLVRGEGGFGTVAG